MSDGILEADLISRSLAGDARAFSALCDRYRTRVWRVIASVAQGPDVEDLAQETVLRAWTNLRGWRGDAPFEAWLCRIAVHAARDYQRSAWRRRVVIWAPGPDEHDVSSARCEPADEAASRRELQRRVRRAVAALPARQSLPVWLHYLEGYNISEIARLERIPESTARSRLEAGLKRLSKTLPESPSVEHGVQPDPVRGATCRATDPNTDSFVPLEHKRKAAVNET